MARTEQTFSKNDSKPRLRESNWCSDKANGHLLGNLGKAKPKNSLFKCASHLTKSLYRLEQRYLPAIWIQNTMYFSPKNYIDDKN